MSTNKVTVLEKLSLLNNFMDENDLNLTHFFIKTELRESAAHGMGRFSLADIQSGTLIAIIGGVLIDFVDNILAMPIGLGLYLHQVNNNKKGTINHSCEPNCIMDGLNRLTANCAVNINQELTIDYGSTVAGNGSILVASCQCGKKKCRGTITSHDYLKLPDNELSGLAKATKYCKLIK